MRRPFYTLVCRQLEAVSKLLLCEKASSDVALIPMVAVIRLWTRDKEKQHEVQAGSRAGVAGTSTRLRHYNSQPSWHASPTTLFSQLHQLQDSPSCTIPLLCMAALPLSHKRSYRLHNLKCHNSNALSSCPTWTPRPKNHYWNQKVGCTIWLRQPIEYKAKWHPSAINPLPRQFLLPKMSILQLHLCCNT